jgi:hypothetical protein
MSFSSFHARLSEQMLGYNPAMNFYPGDTTFRMSTQAPKGRRKSDKDHINASPEVVTLEHYKAALQGERLCATLEERGRGQEGHAFLNTIVMTSLACLEVTKSKLKVRASGLGHHLTTMLLQRMRGRLIGGEHSWKQRRSERIRGENSLREDVDQ